MSYSITVTPLDNESNTKGIANIHIGKKLSATVFIKEDTREGHKGELYVQRPGYETKKKDENGIPIWNNYFGMVGEGSITKMSNAVLEEYQKMLVGGERSKIEDLEITKIDVVSVVPRTSEHNRYERGIATIKINDEFILNSIKVLEGKYGLYISFPGSYDKDNDKEYKYIEAIADVKKEIDKRVVEEYTKVKELKAASKDEVNKEDKKEIEQPFR